MTGKLVQGGPSSNGTHGTMKFALCPRAYALAKVYPKHAAGARGLGGLVHAGLAQHYQRMAAWQKGLAWQEWASPEDAIYHEGKALPAATVAFACEIIARYQEHYPKEHETWEVLLVEQEVAYKLPGCEHLPPKTARLDLAFRSVADKRIWIPDHKTAFEFKASQKWSYPRTLQFLFLQYLGKQLAGDAFAGVLINRIQTDPDKIKFDRIKAEYIPARVRSVPHTVAFYDGVRASMDKMVLDPADYPANPSEDTCQGRYHRCDHWQECDAAWPDSAGLHPGIAKLIQGT